MNLWESIEYYNGEQFAWIEEHRHDKAYQSVDYEDAYLALLELQKEILDKLKR